MAQLGQRVRINNRVFSPAQLRNSNTRIMFAFAPDSDFVRERSVDGVSYVDLMGDVMGSMTGVANPSELRLHSVSPNYAAEWLAANLPAERVCFCLPARLAEFESMLATVR